MKIVLFTILFISVSFSAQRKKLMFKTDMVRMKKPDPGKPAGSQKDVYKMPNAKPAHDSVYSGMKDKRNDTTDYKILNGITPDPKNSSRLK